MTNEIQRTGLSRWIRRGGVVAAVVLPTVILVLRTGSHDHYHSVTSRGEIPLLPVEQRSAMLGVLSEIKFSCELHPPETIADLSAIVHHAAQKNDASKLFEGRLRLAVNPDLRMWREVSTWNDLSKQHDYDTNAIAIICHDTRSSSDRRFWFQGLTFVDEIVFRLKEPDWWSHAVFVEQP